MRLRWIRRRSAALTFERSVSLGKYWRKRPFVSTFSGIACQASDLTGERLLNTLSVDQIVVAMKRVAERLPYEDRRPYDSWLELVLIDYGAYAGGAT